MKMNELRIGNIVEINGEYVMITGITEHGIYYGKHGYIANLLDLIKPIPLTDEILTKWCGFTEDTIFGSYKKYKRGFLEIWYDASKGTFLVENIKNKKVYIEYLHQLQNLVFAMTGEELEVKLPNNK